MAKGQLRHIAISVPDKEKTAKFYEMWSDCLAGRQRGPWRCTLSSGLTADSLPQRPDAFRAGLSALGLEGSVSG